MVWLPASIRPRPCATIAKPPRTRPIRPGSPNRVKTIGPSRITAKSRKNSSTKPCGHWIAKRIIRASSRLVSVLGQDQRHVGFALPEPAQLEPVDRPVRLERADRRVDDLDVVGALRQDG